MSPTSAPTEPTDPRRQELGAFLQSLRRRCAPEAFGFPSGNRRRTPGLRREEAAHLAQISPTWYTWLEQGREVRVSADVLDRLARSLRLTSTERAYLFDMAARRDPHATEAEDDNVHAAYSSVLAEITMPAYIMGRYWDVLAWNSPAQELFAGWLGDDVPAQAHNMLRFVFLHPQARTLVVDWETRARRITAEFRADCRSRFADPALQRLVNELCQASLEFARFWQQHDVLERQGGMRVFNHPQRGLVTYRQVTLRPQDQDHLKLVLLQPAQAHEQGGAI